MNPAFRILHAALLASMATAAHAAPLTLLNPSFTGDANNGNPAAWTTTEASSGYIYVASTSLPNGNVLAFHARPGINHIQQSFSTSEITADSHGRFTIEFEAGWRNNTASPNNLGWTVSIINVTDGNSVLGSATYTLPPDSPNNAFDNYRSLGVQTLTIDYDNTSPSLVGDTIAIRIESDSSQNSFNPTGWIDNLSVEAGDAPPLPPTITAHPQSATASQYGPHTFTVSASGTPPFSHQWKKNGEDIDGATSASLVLTNLTFDDAGSYTVVVTNDHGNATSDSATLTVTPYPTDVSAAAGIVSRLLPDFADHFIIEFTPPENGADVFELDSAGEKIVLRGNTGVSVASALHHYLREFCGCHVSRNGDQLSLPAPLPRVAAPVRVVSPHRVRFFFNATTFGYTSAWWGWDEWQREIDLLALHGVNLAQVTPGAEELLRHTLRDHFGYTDEEVRDWLCMPSHLPWMLMGNMHSFGGPVPASVCDARLALGQQICARMLSLGMQPSLQGYYGIVPQDFKTRYPAADVRAQGNWVGGFQRPDMLNPTDPLFATFSQHYYQIAASLFPGVTHFAADPFHEGGSTTGIDLGAAGRALLDGMAHADPRAVWVAQAWTGTPKQEMLDAVDKSRVLVLDLNCSNNEQWRTRNAFNNTPWVWCAIQNFGGNTGMIAKLGAIANRPAAALADPNKGPMAGIGAVPEASDTIPAAYELLFDHGWRSEAPDLASWVNQYARRRYGKTLPSLEDAWKILLETSMNLQPSVEEPHNSIAVARPSLSASIKARTWSTTDIPYRAARFAEAWGLMLDAAGDAGGSDGYRFDLADVARQTLCDLATRHQRMLGKAYTAGDTAAVHLHGDRILEIIADLETLCASRPEWLLGTWLNDARATGATPAEADLCEWNARVLLTTWSGSVSNLNDYANREWAGLLGGFYLPRWQPFLTALYDAVDNSQPFDESAVRDQIGAWEVNWANGTENHATLPVGNTVAIATALWAKYGAEATGDFDLTSSSVGSTWTPAVCSTSPVGWMRDLSGVIDQPGTWVITFQYTSGAHALQIHEVSLLDGTNLVRSDAHPGWTGIATYDNRYYLRIDSLPANPVLKMITSTAGGTESNGTITISRCEEVPLSGSWSAADLSTNRRIFTMDASATVTEPGDYRVTLDRTSGDSALTVDRVWLEQSGEPLAIEIRDETLSATAPQQLWSFRLHSIASGQPVTLKFAAGSATAAGSNGTINLEFLGSLAANPISWNDWAASNGLDPARPELDSDHDGIADGIEFLQGGNPAVPDPSPPLQLQTDAEQMVLAFDWLNQRTGIRVRIQSSSGLTVWEDPAPRLTWLSDNALPGDRTRSVYQIAAGSPSEFYRLVLEPSP